MKLLTPCLIVFLLYAFSKPIFAGQLNTIQVLKDSLTNAQNANDSANILCHLTWNSGWINPVETKKAGDLALSTALTTTDSVLIASAYDASAHGHRVTGNIEIAIKQYLTTAKIAIRHRAWSHAGWAYWHLYQIELNRDSLELFNSYARKSARYFDLAEQPLKVLACYQMLNKYKLLPYPDSLISIAQHYLDKEKNDETRLFLLVQLSNLYEMQENRKEATFYLQEAMELADKTSNVKGIIKVYSGIAYYLKNVQHNYPAALRYMEKSLEIKEENNAWGLGTLYIEIGDLHRLMHNDSLALEYFNKGLKYGWNIKHRHTLASGYMKIGELHYQNKNYPDALNFYLKCYETGCDECPQIKFHDALINIANVYVENNDVRNARLYFEKSLELADSAKDDKALALSYQAFGDFYLSRNSEKALENYLKAYSHAQTANFLEGQQYAAGKISTLYHIKQNYSNAFNYLQVSKHLSDSINIINEAHNLAKLETHLDFRNLQTQRELEKKIAQEELSQQKQFRNFSLLGVFLLTVLIVIVLLGYRRIRKDNKLLKQQKSDIQEMSRKVHLADQDKLDFYTNVSHEFRTPLTVIMGMTEQLEHGNTNRSFFTTIRRNALRLLQLINHLLDLRKLDVEGLQLNIAEYNILDFTKGIMATYEELARKKQIDINFTHSIKQTNAYFDKDKLEKIISNLLSNAIKYTNSNGRVQVLIKQIENSKIQIIAKDNGIGISKDDLPNIFNRFYRVSESQNQGSGIGLALLKELVNLHKGHIQVESELGVGSTFTVSIPVSKDIYLPQELGEPVETTKICNYNADIDVDDDVENDVELDVTKNSVLVVEDNKDLREYISNIFAAEFLLISACDGREGILKAQKYIPDIIISDVMMPHVSGIELVEKIKNDNRTSHIPIILLTAKSDIASRIRGYEKGADDYLNKPFDSTVLKSRVGNLLRIRKQLVEKFSKQFNLQPREIAIENTDQKFLQNTIDLIEKHLSDPNLNVDLLALNLGVSRTQLYRKLKALTDYSANQFIRIIRLKRAAQILKHGQNNIAEVMDATGFSNYSHFNNCFKEYFGEYPKDYMLLSVKGSLN